MNRTISMGRLTDEPKISETANGKKIARFTMALDRIKEGADFPNFVAWDKRAEFMENWCHKGTKLLIEGHIQTGSYEGKNGKVYTTDIVCDSIEFCEKKQKTEEQPENDPNPFIVPDEDMEIPFT